MLNHIDNRLAIDAALVEAVGAHVASVYPPQLSQPLAIEKLPHALDAREE